MNYTELVKASIAYADRHDIEVSDNIDVFIIMTEAKINRLLKTRKQSIRTITATITDQEYYSLPPDYVGMRDIQFNAVNDDGTYGSSPYTYLSPVEFNSKRNQPYGGKLYYTVIADQIQIFPTQEEGNNLEIVYYQKVPNLNPVENTNWISEDHPDIYLAGITSEIEAFAKNYSVSEAWQIRLNMAVGELDESDTTERWSGSPLQIRAY